MADEPTKEQKYSCGCHVVDGELVAECTQVAPRGEISAERHGVAKPFSAKCFRLAAIAQKAEEADPGQADPDAKDNQSSALPPVRGTSPLVPFPGPVVSEGHIEPTE